MSLSAIIQARMASNRLPGKVALRLSGVPVIKHDIRRASAASIVDEVIVATTFHDRDDLIAKYAHEEDARVYRGSEDDVLGRLRRAAESVRGDTFVRLTGDNPLVPPELIDVVGETVLRGEVDYASNKLERTFPVGVDAEALTVQSIVSSEESTHDPYYREHATKYIRESRDEFATRNITVADVYGEPIDTFDPEIRLTLDEVADYQLFRELYERSEYDDIPDTRDAVRLISDCSLGEINKHVNQKTL